MEPVGRKAGFGVGRQDPDGVGQHEWDAGDGCFSSPDADHFFVKLIKLVVHHQINAESTEE
jgi:hypothetical protein